MTELSKPVITPQTWKHSVETKKAAAKLDADRAEREKAAKITERICKSINRGQSWAHIPLNLVADALTPTKATKIVKDHFKALGFQITFRQAAARIELTPEEATPARRGAWHDRQIHIKGDWMPHLRPPKLKDEPPL